MYLIDRYLEKVDFDNYQDFSANLKYKPVSTFNFGYDVVDEYARLTPNKRALVWCNNLGEEHSFTFSDISRLSNKVCQRFIKARYQKG